MKSEDSKDLNEADPFRLMMPSRAEHALLVAAAGDKVGLHGSGYAQLARQLRSGQSGKKNEAFVVQNLLGF